ncbi:hypothetical protein B7P43_G17584, partial [Cryptotermes secundus]
MEKQDLQRIMEMLIEIKADRKVDKEEMETNRKKDKEDFLAKLDADRKVDKEETEANRKKDKEDFLAKLEADRKTDKEEMLARMDANMKTHQEDFLTKLDAYQEKATADKEELKAEMRSMRSQLDDKIQHKVENILAIVEHDKQNIQEELTKTCAAIEGNKRDFKAQLEVVQTRTERGITPTVVASTAQPPTFNGNSTWSVFRRQFETVAEH